MMTMMSKKELIQTLKHISPLRFSLLFSSSAARNSARLFSLSLCFFFRALSLSRGFGVFFGRSVSRALRDGKRETDFDDF